MILVTGASGVTGGFVVEELRRRGRALRILSRAEVDAPAGVEVALGDLRDVDSLARAARGATGIVHIACIYTDRAADVAATRALVESWREGPFVFTSTLDVYGLASGLVTEDAPLSATFTDYARGKVECERLLGAAGRGDHTILRAPYIWGPHPTARRRLVTPRLAEGLPIVLPGTDEAEWQGYRDAFVDARDLAVIVAECLARPAGGALNVATGHVSWHDLYAELIRWTGSRSTIVHKPLGEITDEELPKKELHAQTWRFSEERLARHLGTIPRRPFEVTVRDTILGI
jgi:nucleoside-diphosphate-sugar epimerase